MSSVSVSVEGIKTLVAPIIEEMGLDLWDVEVNTRGAKYVVGLYIDSEDGITLDDCKAVSRRISILLDAEDPIDCAYFLEVASPGLDRKLRGPADYIEYSGQPVRIECTEPIEKSRKWKGNLIQYKDDSIFLCTDSNQDIMIPLSFLKSVRLDPFSKKHGKGGRKKDG